MNHRPVIAVVVGGLAIAGSLAMAIGASGAASSAASACLSGSTPASSLAAPETTPPETLNVPAPETDDPVDAVPSSDIVDIAAPSTSTEMVATVDSSTTTAAPTTDVVEIVDEAPPTTDEVVTTAGTAPDDSAVATAAALRHAVGDAVAAEPAPPPREVIRVKTLLTLEPPGFVKFNLLTGRNSDPCNVFPKMTLNQLPDAQNRKRWYIEIKAFANQTCDLASVTVRDEVDTTAGLLNLWNDADLRQGRKTHEGIRIYFNATIDDTQKNAVVIVDLRCRPGTPPFP